MKTRLIERGAYLKSIHGSYHLDCRPRYYKLLTHLDFMAIMRGHWRKSNIFNLEGRCYRDTPFAYIDTP